MGVKDKKIGLVLAGGGGRGAYQIGVWKALRETGLEGYITAVAGSSVGGLNAALFTQGGLDKAEEIWRSISPEIILTSKFKSEDGFKRMSLFERDGLRKIIADGLDMRCFDPDENNCNCWLTCARVDRRTGKWRL